MRARHLPLSALVKHLLNSPPGRKLISTATGTALVLSTDASRNPFGVSVTVAACVNRHPSVFFRFARTFPPTRPRSPSEPGRAADSTAPATPASIEAHHSDRSKWAKKTGPYRRTLKQTYRVDHCVPLSQHEEAASTSAEHGRAHRPTPDAYESIVRKGPPVVFRNRDGRSGRRREFGILHHGRQTRWSRGKVLGQSSESSIARMLGQVRQREPIRTHIALRIQILPS